ncbi:Deoxynucleotidyltransferase terminal-interacting protein 2 [Oryzias melastigma]|uniref:Deoxynucleotidyltransferase terminal-interacting protein 2 n=1 Tax=Oryzias melastigma TaxID=30732 RepID=A0A834C7Q4_ORYME|nr:Deoxynucleotidyltransferase terminal-interacting protein 2 [Oryzias melastigma]
MKPCEEKKQEEEEKQEHMEVCRPDAQQVEDLQETAGGSQEAPDSKQQPQAAFSLLDSSDEDEELDEELEEGSAQEDLDHMDQERGETSSKSKPAAASVEGLFMIDTRPGQDPDQQYYTDWKGEEDKNKRSEEEEPDEDEFVDEEEEEDEDAEILLSSRNSHLKELSSRIDPGISVKKLGGLYISFDGSKSKGVSTSGQKPNGKTTLDEVMKKSVIGPDFEKKDAVPPYKESKEALKLKRRAERQKSTGDGWFNMKAPEVSQELKGDLQVLKMRGSLDPKRFYKKNDRDGFPKYFQVGTVVDKSSGLLPLPCSQEGEEENHGGGAADRRRVQTEKQKEVSADSWQKKQHKQPASTKRRINSIKSPAKDARNKKIKAISYINPFKLRLI